MSKPKKENVPGYISLGFIAAYCAFLVVLAVLSVRDHKKAKRDYIIGHFGRVSDSKEVQQAYKEKDKETKKKRPRFYINDDGKIYNDLEDEAE